MNNTKQIILVRRDVKLPKGKLGSQVAHASMAAILDLMLGVSRNTSTNQWEVVNDTINNCDALVDWLNGSFTKICLRVDNEEQIRSFHSQAVQLNIPTSLIVDNGTTVFNGIPTVTTCALGPYWNDELDKLTGNLTLL